MMALHGPLVCDSVCEIGALTKLGLFFPMVCFICVFDETLAEQLYREGLLCPVCREKNSLSAVYIIISLKVLWLLLFFCFLQEVEYEGDPTTIRVC